MCLTSMLRVFLGIFDFGVSSSLGGFGSREVFFLRVLNRVVLAVCSVDAPSDRSPSFLSLLVVSPWAQRASSSSSSSEATTVLLSLRLNFILCTEGGASSSSSDEQDFVVSVLKAPYFYLPFRDEKTGARPHSRLFLLHRRTCTFYVSCLFLSIQFYVLLVGLLLTNPIPLSVSSA